MERNGEPVSGAGPGGRLLKEHGQRLRLGDPAGDAEREQLPGPTGDGDDELQGATGGGDAEGERLHLGGPTGDGEPRGTRDAEDEAAGRGEERAAGELRGRSQRNGVQGNGKGGGGRGDRKQKDQQKPHLGSPGGQPRQRGDDQAATRPHCRARPTSMGFSRSGAPGGGSPLLDGILSWTVTDVLNDNLYKDKISNVPDMYESPAHFCAIQSNLLLEETRAVICSSIKNRAETDIQFCQLLSVDKWDSSSGFFLDIDLSITIFDDIKYQHIATDGDICILSLKAPLVSDVDVMSSHLGIVVNVGRDLLCQRSFRVLVSDVAVFQPEKIKFVSFLTNIANELEIANILSLHDERDQNAVKSLLGLHKMVGKKCSTCVELPHDKDNLCTEKQLSLSSLTCLHQHNTEIIRAPPGTLKGSIAAVLKCVSHKILICVTSVSSLTDLMIDLEELSISPDSGDILVLNNMGQEGIKGYENFFLQHQSQELYCFLSQHKALKTMNSLLDLSTFYHVDCAYVGSCERCSKPGLLKFSVASFKEKFDIILSQFFSSLVYLKNHAAAFSLPEQNSIEELMNVMKKFETLLYDKNQRDEYIGAAFGLVPPAAIDSTSVDSASTIAMSMNKERMTCVKLIESIRSSVQLPVLENRDAIDRFCIKHSRIIVATLDCTWQLRGMDKDEFDILLVHGAGQVREDQLLASFLLPVRHTVLFGDHLHLQPSVQSMVCKEAGYNVSIFERLQQLVSEKQILNMQYTMHPSISKFPNNYFYGGILKDGHNVMSAEYSEFIPVTLPSYGFMDISADYLRQTRKAYVSSAAIIMLVQEFCEDMMIPSRKVHIGVMCLSKDDSDTVRGMLRLKKEIHDKIHLEVKCIDDLQEKSFDVVILLLLVDNETELEGVKENSLNVVLTSARHCLWMVGEQNLVSDTGGIWNSLIYDARTRFCIEKVDINKLTVITKQLEKNGKGHCPDSNSRLASKILQMPRQEFTWAERPYMTKMILAPVRNQRGQPDTCSFQSASGAVESLLKYRNAGLVPPQEFNWTFLLDDWKNEYETVAPKRFLSEDKADRGEKRIQTSLGLYKSNGVVATNESGTKFRRFKIKDYGIMDKSDTEAVTARLKKGGIMVGTFPISRNYYSLSPRDVYVYDPDKVIKHEKSGLTATHVAMIIGIGHRMTESKRFSRHMVMQNSEGKLFGINGIGRIGKKKTLRKLYWIEVEDVKPKPAPSTSGRRRRRRGQASKGGK